MGVRPAASYKRNVSWLFSKEPEMKIHEYQAKELLAAAGASIPKGIVVTTAAEAQHAYDRMNGPVVLKAQIHAGGRGNGRFKDSCQDWGGVKFIRSHAESARVAEVM